MASVTFPASQGELRGYLERPAGDGPWPAVVVIHDVLGVNADMQRQCGWLAQAGYLALAPDLYSRGRKLTCLRSIMADLRAGRGRNFEDIDAARDWLIADTASCTGRVGVIGYCMGGGFSLLLAPNGRYDVSSVNYGRVPADAERVLAGACPIVAGYGARDRGLKGAAAKLESALGSLNVPCDVKEYPDAGHGFLNHFEGGVGVLVGVMGRIVGVGYHEPSAADARRRIIEFFDQRLKEG
jgi:carboxymethylenebutenolidase